MNKKRRRKNNNSVLYTLIEVLSELVYRFIYGVVEEMGKIAVILQICISVCVAYFCNNIFQMIILSCVLTVTVKYIKEVGNRLNHTTDDGFPIPYHRFTRKDSNGFVDVREDEINEAIVYLCDVEDYLKSKGWLL